MRRIYKKAENVSKLYNFKITEEQDMAIKKMRNDGIMIAEYLRQALDELITKWNENKIEEGA